MTTETTEQPAADGPGEEPQQEVKAEDVFTYTAPWPVYALSFCSNPRGTFKLGFGSFIEDPGNKVEVIQLNESTKKFDLLATFDHVYPPTKVMWMPNASGSRPDLLASSTDSLRIWQTDNSPSLKCNLVNLRSNEFNAPLTSFDWNADDPNMLATSSIDTTCTVWDLERETVRTQMIAHDNEVYDVAFAKGVDTLASVGADGSVRQFDLRDLEHSSILYESPGDFTPLLRLAWNRVSPFFLAALAMDSNVVMILDIRGPPVPVTELSGHQNSVNALAWAPNSAHHISTAGDDNQVLIWDLNKGHHSSEGDRVTEPLLAYTAGAEIPALQWPTCHSDWIAVAFNKSVQTVKI